MKIDWLCALTSSWKSRLPLSTNHRRTLCPRIDPLESRLVLDGSAARLAEVWSAQAEPAADTVAPDSSWIVRLPSHIAAEVTSLREIGPWLSTSQISFEAVQGLGSIGLVELYASAQQGPWPRGANSSLSFAQQVDAELRASPLVQSFELNGAVSGQLSPNDPAFASNALVGLRNPGLDGATSDADIDAEEAWDLTTGSEGVITAVIDSGIDYTHRDLYLNVWLNPGEIPNAIRTVIVDDDASGQITFRDLNRPVNAALVSDLNGTGYIDAGDLLRDPRWENGFDEDQNGKTDDLIGWDFRDNDNDPMDTHGHGTHVSGTIGAIGNNGLGVAGVNWITSLLPLRFLAAVEGQGLTGSRTDAIAAINYSTALAEAGAPIKVSNNSWGSIEDPSPELRTAIAENGAAGVLFVAAAGNGEGRTGRGIDLDTERVGFYPASFDLTHIVAVGASDGRDNLALFSQYGKTSIDLVAPGVGILSTDLNGTYAVRNGTSMAAPHVSGAAALLFTRQSDATIHEIRTALLQSVDTNSQLTNRVATGGRLNAKKALDQDTYAPKVALTTPLNVTTEDTFYEFSITYRDNVAIDLASVDGSDAFVAAATESAMKLTAVVSDLVIDSDPTTSGDQPRVTYKITPPGGKWDQTDNGLYEISLANDAIADTRIPTANRTTGRLLGTFRVDIQYAGEIDVSTFNDGADANVADGVSDIGNGQSSLRSAIQTANAEPGLNTLVLDAGTYQLTLAGAAEDTAATGDLDITDDLLIYGNGAVIEVSGMTDRVFDVLTSGKLTLRDVTIQNGAAGSESGGGLRQQGGTVEVFNSLFVNNSATSGGAIAQTGGVMSLTNTTISGNSATNAAGLDIAGGMLTALHVTVTENSASDATGGLRQASSGQATLLNTLIAGNSATNSDADVSGAIHSATSSLIGDIGSATGITHGTAGNQAGTSASPIDPQLGPLLQRTGLTRGHEPRFGSPAVDTANATFVTLALGTSTDQRGIARSQNGDQDAFKEPDIGAFERFYAEVSGTAYQDLNDNSQQDANEPGIPGFTMVLDVNQNGVADPGEPTQITSADDPATTGINEAGRYTFEGLSTGQYRVLQQTGAGFQQLSPDLDTKEGAFDVTQLTAAAGGDGSKGFVLNGSAPNRRLGLRAGGIGDFNGDELADFIVDDSTSTTPPIIIYGQRGTTSPESRPETDAVPGYQRTTITASGGSLGVVLAGGIGDINSDGTDDLLVTGTVGTTPATFIVYGAHMPITSSRTLSLGGGEGFFRIDAPFNLNSTARLSVSSFASGDVNGDGFSDIIIGYTGADPAGRINAGQVFVVYGRGTSVTGVIDLASNPGNEISHINGMFTGDSLGATLSSGSDVNGDGVDDIVVGASGAFRQFSGGGECYIIFGRRDHDFVAELADAATTGLAVVLARSGNNLGLFSAIGDLDKDGIADVIVGGESLNVWVIKGSRNLSTQRTIQLPDTIGPFLHGISLEMDFSGTISRVVSFGDFNGDGHEDFGRSNTNFDLVNNQDVGSVVVVFGDEISSLPSRLIPAGSSAVDRRDALRIHGIASFDQLGISLTAINDTNGDGFDDLLVATFGADPFGDDSGQIYVIFGQRDTELRRRDGYYLVDAQAGRSITQANFGNRAIPAVVTGSVFRDVNLNAQFDGGELGLGDLRVYLDLDHDGVFDTGEPNDLTDATGVYSIGNVAPLQEYDLRVVVESGFEQTLPTQMENLRYQITPGAGETLQRLDFGLSDNTGGVGLGTGTLTGRVFEDGNRNGRLDNGELGIAGVTVFLDANDNGLLDETPTPEPRVVTAVDNPVTTSMNEAGTYAFEDLDERDYVVRMIATGPQVPTGPLVASFGSSSMVAGEGPVAAVSMLYNGDAWPDLVIVTAGKDDLLVQLNNGNGTFAPAMSIASEAVKAAIKAPKSMVAADLNGDGRTDLVIGNSVTNKPAVLLNDGKGGFTPAPVPTLGRDTSRVAIGQFTLGDSTPDLAVVSEFDNTVRVLANNGSGVFAERKILTTGRAPTDLIAADLDNDGDSDLVVANLEDNTLRTFLLKSDGNFEQTDGGGLYTRPTGLGPFRLATGDFNGDSFLDVVVANVFDQRLSIFINRQSGAFLDAKQVRVGAQPASVVTGDFNNDGLVDIAATTVSATGFSILFNLGNGVFQAPSTSGVASLIEPLAPALVTSDIDMDGDRDLLLLKPERDSGRVFVERNAPIAGAYRVSAIADSTQGNLNFGVQTPNTPPTSSNIADVTIAEDSASSAISFTIGDAETAAADLTVAGTSSNTTLIPNSGVVIGGSGANRTVRVTPAPNQAGSTTITLAISDGSTTVMKSFGVTVTQVDDAPTISSLNDVTLVEDSAGVSVLFTIGDLESGASGLTLSKASTNTSLISISNITFVGNAANRSVTIVPTANAFGSATITLTVSDGVLTTSKSFLVTVTGVNDAPTVSTINNVTTTEDTPTNSISFSIGDAETSTSSLSLSGASSNLALVPVENVVFGGSGSSRTVRITPVPNASGRATVSVIVTDAGLLSTTRTFDVIVTAVNDAPTVSTIANQTINEDSSTSALSFTIGDVDSALSSLSIVPASSNPTLVTNEDIAISGSGASRFVTVTPRPGQMGTSTISLVVSDGTASTTRDFTLTVNPIDGAPSISLLDDVTIDEDTTTDVMSFLLADADTPFDGLSVTARSSNPALIPDANIRLEGEGAARTVVVVPVSNGHGAATITLSLSDGTSVVEEAFDVIVTSVNDAPQMTAIADLTVPEDTGLLSLDFNVTDLDTELSSLQLAAISSNQTLVAESAMLIVGDSNARSLRLSPAANRFGSTTITVTLNDRDTVVTQSFVLTVTAVNDRPTISAVNDVTIDEDGTSSVLSFTIGDVETPAANLNVTALSSNTSLISNTGIARGGNGANRTVVVTPNANRFGQSTITLTVTDNGLSVRETFVVTVIPVNDAPTISALPDVTIDQNSDGVELGLVIGDIETLSDSLRLSAVSSNEVLVPSNSVTFSGSGTNRFVQVRPAANQRGSAIISVQVSDSTTTSTETFTLTVNGENTPPELVIPSEVTLPENTAEVLVVSAVDETPGSMVFSISGSAADNSLFAINATTGALRFVTAPDFETPRDADRNNVYVVEVSVSDGQFSSQQLLNVTVTDVTLSPTITLPDTVNTVVLSRDGREFVVTRNSMVVFRENFDDVVSVSLQGGSLADTITANGLLAGFGPITWIIDGGSGADQLNLSAAGIPMTLRGADGNDTLIGSAEADSLLGGAGDDRLTGGLGADMIDGGLGNDTLSETADFDMTLMTASLVISRTGQGSTTDVLSGIEVANLTGGAGANVINASDFVPGSGLIVTLTGGGGADVISGTNGRDLIVANSTVGVTVSGGSGNDTITTGSGNDSVLGVAGNDSISTGAGRDTVNGGTGNDTIDGGLGNDSLNGQNDHDSLIGGDNDDRLSGGDGNDVLDGGLGADILKGDDGLDTLSGGAGADDLQGGKDNDRLSGGDDADSLDGAFGNDTLEGGNGDDTLRGNVGVDDVDGGTGNDRLTEGNGTETAAMTVVITGMQMQNSAYGNETSRGVELFVINGGSGNDKLDARGSSVKVQFRSGAGADTLLGSAFADFLSGADGDDVISGGAGNDAIDGGLGSDFFYEKVNANFTINGLQVVSTATGSETLLNIERIALVGRDGNNVLDATSSSVSVILVGGKGNDTLRGSSFDDVLVGGSRTATPTTPGGDGTDSLVGGAGTDTYDNDPLDSRPTLEPNESTLANVFAGLPSWLDLI